MSANTLNQWQRREMRASALSFRRAYPFPSVIAHAITHRELSFPRPMYEQRARIREGIARAMARHFPKGYAQ